MSSDELVAVYGFPDRMEAGIAVSALEAAGIDAIVIADDIGGMRPHVAWASGGYKVMVRPEDAENAREILTETASVSELE